MASAVEFACELLCLGAFGVIGAESDRGVDFARHVDVLRHFIFLRSVGGILRNPQHVLVGVDLVIPLCILGRGVHRELVAVRHRASERPADVALQRYRGIVVEGLALHELVAVGRPCRNHAVADHQRMYYGVNIGVSSGRDGRRGGERHRYLVVRSARYGRGLVVRIPELGVRRQVCRIEPRQGLVPGCLEIDPADRYVVVRIVHQPDAEQREYPRETQFYRGSIVRIVDHRGGHGRQYIVFCQIRKVVAGNLLLFGRDFEVARTRPVARHGRTRIGRAVRCPRYLGFVFFVRVVGVNIQPFLDGKCRGRHLLEIHPAFCLRVHGFETEVLIRPVVGRIVQVQADPVGILGAEREPQPVLRHIGPGLSVVPDGGAYDEVRIGLLRSRLFCRVRRTAAQGCPKQ